ncbi:MAG: VOC family protein [Rhizobiaceae bacterium]|nr:VOC family protein [Rhizobiaceae bacterium]
MTLANDQPPALLTAEPMIFVIDFAAALAYYTSVLGFGVEFTYGDPPFYGQVRRDGARLNLRHADTPVIDPARARADDFLSATVGVQNADALFEEFQQAGAAFHQRPRTEPWGARTFIVLDPDDNLVMFAGEGA